jgi:hypothetical protein
MNLHTAANQIRRGERIIEIDKLQVRLTLTCTAFLPALLKLPGGELIVFVLLRSRHYNQPILEDSKLGLIDVRRGG